MGETNAPKKFRYQEILDGLETPCPPADFEARETLAYRWVFDTMDDPMNFVPQYVKKPDRFTEKSDFEKCLAMGLSFFNSEENARKRFHQIKGFMGENAYLTLGEKVAEGTLLPEMGVSDKPTRDGHFTHFPFDEILLEPYFTIISRL